MVQAHKNFQSAYPRITYSRSAYCKNPNYLHFPPKENARVSNIKNWPEVGVWGAAPDAWLTHYRSDLQLQMSLSDQYMIWYLEIPGVYPDNKKNGNNNIIHNLIQYIYKNWKKNKFTRCTQFKVIIVQVIVIKIKHAWQP